MEVTLYVSYIPLTVDEEELEELFRRYGEVSAVMIRRRYRTGKSKGWGYVTMARARDAKTAIAALNDKEWRGGCLSVSKALPPGVTIYPW
jgi:polyadenylate-binding protein